MWHRKRRPAALVALVDAELLRVVAAHQEDRGRAFADGVAIPTFHLGPFGREQLDHDAEGRQTDGIDAELDLGSELGAITPEPAEGIGGCRSLRRRGRGFLKDDLGAAARNEERDEAEEDGEA